MPRTKETGATDMKTTSLWTRRLVLAVVLAALAILIALAGAAHGDERTADGGVHAFSTWAT
jgi:hypothetical protein